MRNAGLGLSGCGIKERVNISYKPGEIVTEERVLKAVQSMIDQSNAENAEFEISCPRVIRIFETNATSEGPPPSRPESKQEASGGSLH